MEQNELYIIYGTDYADMVVRLLEEIDLDGVIMRKCMPVFLHKKTNDFENTDAAGESHGFLTEKAGIRIGIKPNLVAPIPAEDGGTTHPEVVEGLISYLREKGYRNLCIMESSWVGDRTEDAFQVCGYYELAERLQLPLIDIKKEKYRNVNCAGLELAVSEAALDVDFLINVPVLKGHCQTRMTCALKNMKGLLPDFQKRAFHRMGLHEPIGRLSAGIHQDFILVDSICGDLSFEDGGNPVQQDRLIAAADPVLCDSYCCSLLHIPLEEVPYIGIAEACGCGSSDLSSAVIHVCNEPLHSIDLSTAGKALRLQELAEDVEACSACYGNLLPVLYQLQEEGILTDQFTEKICIGQGYKGKCGKLGIGSCTSHFELFLKGCPPEKEEIYHFLKTVLTE